VYKSGFYLNSMLPHVSGTAHFRVGSLDLTYKRLLSLKNITVQCGECVGI
jgi:hypothetical protein